jgi:hypothetical protein
VNTKNDETAAAVTSVDPAAWLEEFDSAFARIAGRFRRVEPRRQARAFLLAVLSDLDLRTCWQVAEQAGDPMVYVIESAVGIVHGATPDGGSWWGCLNPADAVRVYDMPSDMVASPMETVESAMSWAAAAGRTSDAGLIAAAVRVRRTVW